MFRFLLKIMLQKVAEKGRDMSERENESGMLGDRKRQLEQHVLLQIFHSDSDSVQTRRRISPIAD